MMVGDVRAWRGSCPLISHFPLFTFYFSLPSLDLRLRTWTGMVMRWVRGRVGELDGWQGVLGSRQDVRRLGGWWSGMGWVNR